VAERRIAATLGRLRVLLDGGVDPGGLSDSKGRSSSRHHLKEITRDVERGERECSRVPEDAPTAGTATCQVQEGPMRASHEVVTGPPAPVCADRRLCGRCTRPRDAADWAADAGRWGGRDRSGGTQRWRWRRANGFFWGGLRNCAKADCTRIGQQSR